MAAGSTWCGTLWQIVKPKDGCTRWLLLQAVQMFYIFLQGCVGHP
jgi:hypothetical protein